MVKTIYRVCLVVRISIGIFYPAGESILQGGEGWQPRCRSFAVYTYSFHGPPLHPLLLGRAGGLKLANHSCRFMVNLDFAWADWVNIDCVERTAYVRGKGSICMKRLFIAVLNALGMYQAAHSLYRMARYGFDLRLRKKNRQWIKRGAPDGLPVPPPHLVNLVAGHFDIDAFYRNGRVGADCIRAILQKNGIEMRRFLSILDFGCGCGRILRFWEKLDGPEIHGSDYNPSLVRWCQAHLPFGEFKTNGPHPPLDYPNERFGLIYAVSVFTHFAEELQIPWMQELWRICLPGGYVLITLHGESYLQQLHDDERQRFEGGRLAVIRERYSGTNICGVFHPESYVRNTLAEGFSVVDFLPLGAKDANQDMYLLQKPPLS
jgi:SAM-dependent methyltransferase